MGPLYDGIATIPERLRSTDCSELTRVQRLSVLMELVLTLTEQRAPRTGVWLILRPMLSGMRSAMCRSSPTEDDAVWLVAMLRDVSEWLDRGNLGVPSNPPIGSASSEPPEAARPTSPSGIYEASPT